jgi:S-DNA-T family DNA segregation ATPase FtsK/SpoIIIE
MVDMNKSADGGEGENFDWDRAEDDLAAVIDLHKGDPDAAEDTEQNTDRDAEDDYPDRETIVVDRPGVGVPVDRADGGPAVTGSRLPKDRKPVIPDWVRSRQELTGRLRWVAKDAGYVVSYHAARVPKYAAKAAAYAPGGAVRSIGRVTRWASASEGNHQLMQHAATQNDSLTFLQVSRHRAAQARWRWTVVGLCAIPTLVVAGILVFGDIPSIVRILVILAAIPLLALAGRPGDQRITDRVAEGPRYRKLTAELVRTGLTSLGIPAINQAVSKDPKQLSFPSEIHRDGPGHMAMVDLPLGAEASEVVARRARLASALRLPFDQVWPETDRTHPGRLALWVGFEPASAMTPPPWPLLTGEKVDVFKPFPFGLDPRLRMIVGAIIGRNWLFGGQPGSGKSFALRIVVLTAALDPRVELRGYELKGVGDYKVLEPVHTEYGNGFDDDTIRRAGELLEWLYQECQRRSKRIEFYAAQGRCPENKVTPELASLKGSGLHPLLVWFDEVQELMQHKAYGKRAGETAEKCIKLGRALGVTLLLGTQIPDKDSLPTGITRNVNTRFCLSVNDQTANDMILGTSMYKNGYRATVFEPVVQAGWGIAVGLGKPAPYLTYFVTTEAIEKIMPRIIAHREGAGTMPTAPAERESGPSYDLLADVLTIWPDGEDKAWNETLIERLAELRPEIYGGWKPEQLTAVLKPYAIKVDQIGRRIDGKPTTRRGPARADILAVITERNRKAGED